MIKNVGELSMRCDDCDIIDYCNDYEDTPPCAQGRFEDVPINDFLKVEENCRGNSKNDLLDNIYFNITNQK